MASKFDSSYLFNDDFFMDEIRIGGESGESIFGFHKDNFEPRDEGLLAKFPGHWGLMVINKSDMPTRPNLQSELWHDNFTWRIITIHDSGDCWKFNVVTEQRKNR